MEHAVVVSVVGADVVVADVVVLVVDAVLGVGDVVGGVVVDVSASDDDSGVD